jgi:mRNA interferase HicA
MKVITDDNFPFDFVIIFDYYMRVTASELKRKLAKLGCTFEEGTKHLTVYYKGERTLMPRHPPKEIKTGTYHAILKKLGIKE